MFDSIGYPATGPNKDKRDNNYTRPTAVEYFMSLAYLVSKRSHDAQTQHGTVIVDKNNKIVSTGYNGFLSGANDDILPNVRPYKLNFILHSEVNAVISAKRDLSDCTAYITGLPCIECLKVMIQSGIRRIIVGDVGHKFQENYEDLKNILCKDHNVSIIKYKGKLIHLEGRHIT